MWLSHFNILDLLFLLVMIVCIVAGFRRGFISGGFGLLSLVMAVYVAFSLYPYVAGYVSHHMFKPGPWLLPFSFFITLAGAGVALSLIFNAIVNAIPEEVHQSGINKFLGIFPGILNGILWSALLATILLVLPLADALSDSARKSQVTGILTDQVCRAENAISPVLKAHARPLLTSLTMPVNSEEAVKLSFSVSNPDVLPDQEQEMLRLVNKERAKAGLQPLKIDTALTRLARMHSRDMFVRGYFSHQTPEGQTPSARLERARIPYTVAGENIALAPSLTIAHEGLMHSPGHRANILRPSFGHVGIGILDGGKYGLMVTQDFTQ